MKPPKPNRLGKLLSGVLAGASLLLCLILPVLLFLGRIGETGYRTSLLAASIGWFLFATLYQRGNKKTVGT